MDIRVGLVLFAVNVNYPLNASVLVRRDIDQTGNYWSYNNKYGIPSLPMPENKSSIDIVRDIINYATHITGTWKEFAFIEQSGIYDDIDRSPLGRELLIVYTLMLEDTISIKEGYEWLRLDELKQENMIDDHYSIIRYNRTIQKR